MELRDLINFLNKLEKSKIFYKLNKVRDEAIMVEIAVPGQRWEVEFMDDGTVEIEKFLTLPMPKGRGFLGSHSYRSEIHQAIPVCPTVQLAMPTVEVLLAQY
ncbi:hypothetical protein NDK47_07200 [Brevibacillus ruminantium]|uniref:Uncharacterized protein n=1 Tax=Brevibacillus ruminantium TaxID=2950604 RepID=A0ABY4WNT7_9BACL|nr:hypothetical protein [Brevibacillus ruminantium]USG67069.1 hypothetical protein NDK47_07200 [Brevibacillus ruminantium]